MSDRIVSIDILVREVDHPFTVDEAIVAARGHFGRALYNAKPITDEKLSRKSDADEEIVVTAEVVMIRVSDEVSDAAPML